MATVSAVARWLGSRAIIALVLAALIEGTHEGIVFEMSDFDWNDDKNELLKSTRGVSFKDAVFQPGAEDARLR